MMYSAATGSLYSDVHRGVSSLAFGLWGKRWRPPNGTSEGGPTGGSLRPLVWFYFARWIILPGECRPLQQPTFLTHLDKSWTPWSRWEWLRSYGSISRILWSMLIEYCFGQSGIPRQQGMSKLFSKLHTEVVQQHLAGRGREDESLSCPKSQINVWKGWGLAVIRGQL